MPFVNQSWLRTILINKALIKGNIAYSDLSFEYYQLAKVTIDPHHGWDEPLRVLTAECFAANEPALSALVVRKSGENTGYPGPGFWGLPGTPAKGDITGYANLVKAVYAYKWISTNERIEE